MFPFSFYSLNISYYIIFWIITLFLYFLIYLLCFYWIKNEKSVKELFFISFFNFWVFLFLLYNIETTFLWSWELYEKFFIYKYILYGFHFFIFIILNIYIYFKIQLLEFKNKTFFFIYSFLVIITYALIPWIKTSFIPNNEFPIDITSIQFDIIWWNYNWLEKQHFLNNKEYYSKKFNEKYWNYSEKSLNSYKELLKKDIYKYEYISQANHITQNLSVPFLYNAKNMMNYNRAKYYYEYNYNILAPISIWVFSKSYLDTIFIKSDIKNKTWISENRLKSYIKQLNEILDS